MISRNILRSICAATVLSLVLPATQALAQFEGKEKKIADNVNIGFILEKKQSVLVAAKKSFGLFWCDKNNKLYFAQISKTGKLKGKVLLIAEGVDNMHAAWIGDAYIVAFVKIYSVTGEWLVHLAKLNEKGKKIGGFTRPQIGEEPSGYWSTHYPAVGWNGKHIGLAYNNDNFGAGNGSGVYFHRLTKNRATVGKRVFMMDPKYTSAIVVTNSKKNFAVALRDDYAEGGMFFQRYSKSGAKQGTLVRMVDTNSDGYNTEHFNMISTGSGYAIVFFNFPKGVRFCLLDSKMNIIKGPVTINPNRFDGDFIVLVKHRDEYWLFWKELVTELSPTLKYGIYGAKVSADAEVTTGLTRISDMSSPAQEYPLGVASNGKVVMLAYISYQPDYDTNSNGTIYVRKMK